MTTAQMVNDEQAGARLARAIAKQGEDVRKFRGNPWAALLVVSLGFFMTLLDLTIVNIAIPDMISRLHASLDDVLWVINAYTLVLAVLLITAGRLGDLLGQRLMFVTGVVIFTAASAACGLAPGPSWLIAFRVGQGLGAAVLMPQTLAILTKVFPPERRGAALGVWGAVAGVATLAGPTLGGLLVTAFDWRYIFFVNLPVGVVVIALAILLIPEVTERRKHRIDIAGVLLASSAMLAICYGLVEGQRYNWGTITSFVTVPLVIGAGAVLLAVFLLAHELGDVHGRHGDDGHLPAAHHLPAVRAGILSTEGGPGAGPGPGHRYVRGAHGRAAVRPHRRQVHPDNGADRLRDGDGLDSAHRDNLLRLVRPPGTAYRGRLRHGVHLPAHDDGRGAGRAAAARGRRVGDAQHHPAGRSRNRHCGRGGAAAESAVLLPHRAGTDQSSGTPTGGQGQAGDRHPAGREDRHRGGLRPGRRLQAPGGHAPYPRSPD